MQETIREKLFKALNERKKEDEMRQLLLALQKTITKKTKFGEIIDLIQEHKEILECVKDVQIDFFCKNPIKNAQERQNRSAERKEIIEYLSKNPNSTLDKIANNVKVEREIVSQSLRSMKKNKTVIFARKSRGNNREKSTWAVNSSQAIEIV